MEEQLNRDSIKVDYFEWDLLYHFSSHFFVNHFLERIIGLYFIVAVETEIEQTKRNNVAAVAVVEQLQLCDTSRIEFMSSFVPNGGQQCCVGE